MNPKLNAIEIETNTHCNFRCQFCPNHTNPMKKQIMDMKLFEETVSKAEAHKGIEIVSISSYSEPTLNPNFDKIIERLSDSHLELTLYTNGTNLTAKRIKKLKKMKNFRCIIFGIPSLHPEIHEQMTGSKAIEKTARAMTLALENNVKSIVSVPGTVNELVINLPEFYRRCPNLLNNDDRYRLPVPTESTTDRCGALRNKYCRFVDIKDKKLFGCEVPLRWVYVNVEGKIFLCCEDFYRESVYAHISDGSIEEIINSPEAVKMRKYVFGQLNAPKNFICRRCVTMRHSNVKNKDIEEYMKYGVVK